MHWPAISSLVLSTNTKACVYNAMNIFYFFTPRTPERGRNRSVLYGELLGNKSTKPKSIKVKDEKKNQLQISFIRSRALQHITQNSFYKLLMVFLIYFIWVKIATLLMFLLEDGERSGLEDWI